MERRYEKLLSRHLSQSRQMAFVVGPSQVGKTTSALLAAGEYMHLDWERPEDRRLLLAGAEAVAAGLGADTPAETPKHVIFDGMQRYRRWPGFVQGCWDACGQHTKVIVIGPTDQTFGDHALYRMHPLSVAELIGTQIDVRGQARPARLPADGFEQLLKFGGFPEPFARASTRFSNGWRKQQQERLFRQDLRDLGQIREADQTEILGELLAAQVGQLLNYSDLARQIDASVDTVRRWIDILERLYHCFTVRPWFDNVPKSLRKQPKVYLYDWSRVTDPVVRRENLVASHLLKAVHWWTDVGLGTFELRYLRDKTRRAVDFVVIRDYQPWFLVQASSSGHQIDAALEYFHGLLETNHAFQVDFAMDYVEQDCFTVRDPAQVPAVTLLSQLA
jgi:predicted AAA+ superfamily ATPase